MYYKQEVLLVIDKGTELWERINNIAEQTGESIEQVCSSLATTGIYHHMEGNAIFWQRSLPDQSAGKSQSK